MLEDIANKNEGDNPEKKKKKKKKKNKKKNKVAVQEVLPKCEEIPEEELRAETQTNERFRLLGGWPTPVKFKFPNNQFDSYPANELQEYKPPRVKNEETKAKEALMG